jgi:hypothetical protein
MNPPLTNTFGLDSLIPAGLRFIQQPSYTLPIATLFVRTLPQRTKQVNSFVAFDGGVTGVHQFHQAVYPLANSGPGYEVLAASSAFKKGVEVVKANAGRAALSAKWINKIEALVSTHQIENIEISTLIRNDPALLAEFESDWLDACYDEVLAPIGIAPATIAWNWIVLRTVPVTADVDMGVSGNWHYDNHYPPSYFKIMFYLNDSSEHHSGTDFFDADTSRQISDRTGYIGLTESRLKDMGGIISKHERKSLIVFRPEPGDAAIFWPGRVLHRGIYPQGRARYAISFSFMPSVILDPSGNNRAIYDATLPHAVTGQDAPPLFIPTYQTAAPSYPDWAKAYLDRLASMVAARNDPLLETEFDLLVHVARMITLTDAAQLHFDLQHWARTLDFRLIRAVLDVPFNL